MPWSFPLDALYKMLKLELKNFEEYLKLKNLRPKTIKEYLLYAVRFQAIGGNFNNTTISHFLIQKSNQNNVARAFINVLKKYLIYNREELQLTEEEFKEIVEAEAPPITGRKKSRLVIPLLKEDINKLEQTLETEPLKLMLLICYNGGLRLQELISIKISSFNWERLKESPTEMGEVRVNGKGGKEGICLLPNWLIRRIGAYIRANTFKYGTESRLFSISGDTFERRLREAGRKCGLTKMGEDGEYIKETITHPHRLRHSYAVNLLKRGVDIRYIKEALRHSSISSTQIYTQLSKEDLKEKLEQINQNVL